MMIMKTSKKHRQKSRSDTSDPIVALIDKQIEDYDQQDLRDGWNIQALTLGAAALTWMGFDLLSGLHRESVFLCVFVLGSLIYDLGIFSAKFLVPRGEAFSPAKFKIAIDAYGHRLYPLALTMRYLLLYWFCIVCVTHFVSACFVWFTLVYFGGLVIVCATAFAQSFRDSPIEVVGNSNYSTPGGAKLALLSLATCLLIIAWGANTFGLLASDGSVFKGLAANANEIKLGSLLVCLIFVLTSLARRKRKMRTSEQLKGLRCQLVLGQISVDGAKTKFVQLTEGLSLPQLLSLHLKSMQEVSDSVSEDHDENRYEFESHYSNFVKYLSMAKLRYSGCFLPTEEFEELEARVKKIRFFYLQWNSPRKVDSESVLTTG